MMHFFFQAGMCLKAVIVAAMGLVHSQSFPNRNSHILVIVESPTSQMLLQLPNQIVSRKV
jgi:hypothetical protein